jgi:hypothetical protein
VSAAVLVSIVAGAIGIVDLVVPYAERIHVVVVGRGPNVLSDVDSEAQRLTMEENLSLYL